MLEDFRRDNATRRMASFVAHSKRCRWKGIALYLTSVDVEKSTLLLEGCCRE